MDSGRPPYDDVGCKLVKIVDGWMDGYYIIIIFNTKAILTEPIIEHPETKSLLTELVGEPGKAVIIIVIPQHVNPAL